MAIINIGVVTDIHYNDRDPSDAGGGDYRYYRDADDKMTDIVADMNAWADFVVQCGDMGDDQNDSGTVVKWDYIDGFYDNLTVDRFYCMGNHEVGYFSDATWSSKVGYSDVYDSFDSNGIHIVILSAFDNGIAGYSSEQRNWLTTDLATNNSGNGYPVMVFGHYTLQYDDVFSPGASTVRTILENDGLTVACFNGHEHTNPSKVIDTGIEYYSIYGNISGAYADGDKNNYAKVRYDTVSGNITVQGVGQQPDYEYVTTTSSTTTTSSSTSTTTTSSSTTVTTTSSSTTTTTSSSTTTTLLPLVTTGKNNPIVISGNDDSIKNGEHNSTVLYGNEDGIKEGERNENVVSGN